MSSTTLKLPDFLVIGAGRSGTTVLQYSLMQHPQVFMCPVKETNFFTLEGGPGLTGAETGFEAAGDEAWMKARLESAAVRHLDDYASLFSEARADQKIGEVSPSYLYSPRAPKRISAHLPGARLVAVLRQPVERAYSAFAQLKRSGDESADDLASALEAELESIHAGTGGQRHELRVGLYHDQLQRYFSVFPRQDIRLYTYDQLQSDALGMLADLYEFIGVDSSFRADTSIRYNSSGAPRSAWLDRLLRRRSPLRSTMKRVLPAPVISRLAGVQSRVENRNLVRSELSDRDKAELTERFFREDIERTQRLTGLDLSHWLP